MSSTSNYEISYTTVVEWKIKTRNAAIMWNTLI